MNEARYTGVGEVYRPVYICNHCGCFVYDTELHDRVNGLDLIDAGERAMKGATPLAPPEPPS